jgi:hypothetical protein
MTGFVIKERHKEVLMVAALGVACAFLGFFVLIQPALRDINWLRQEIRTAEEKIRLYQETVRLGEKIEKSETVLAETSERSMLIARISDISGKNGVEVQGINPKIVPADKYEKLLLEVDLKGSFLGILKLLQDLQSIHPVLDIPEISLTRSKLLMEETKDSTVNALQGKLVIVTYLKQKKAVGS